jgi:hypothetical protein
LVEKCDENVGSLRYVVGKKKFFFWWDWDLNLGLCTCKAGCLYHLSHTSRSFCSGVLEIESQKLSAWVGLLILASQEARIIVMSHLHLAWKNILIAFSNKYRYYFLLVYQNLTSSGIFLLLPFCSRD